MLYTVRVDVSAYHRARVINPNRFHQCCAGDLDVGERSLGPRKAYRGTACAGAPARSDTRGIDAIKSDARRAGAACAIRLVDANEGVRTTQDHSVLDPGAVDVIAGDCTCIVYSIRIRLLRCREGLDVSEQERHRHHRRNTYGYTQNE